MLGKGGFTRSAVQRAQGAAVEHIPAETITALPETEMHFLFQMYPPQM